MIRANSKPTVNVCPASVCSVCLGLLAGLLCFLPVGNALAEPAVAPASARSADGSPTYNVQGYAIEGKMQLSTNVLVSVFSKYTGTSVSLQQIVQAASALQAAYLKAGYPAVNIVIAPKKITNGIVTLDVFEGAIAQIVVAGQRYLSSGVPAATETNLPAMEAPAVPEETNEVAAATNAPPPVNPVPTTPATPEQITQARLALAEKMMDLKDTRIHVVSTNAGPHFQVNQYLVTGNSVLSAGAVAGALTNIDGDYGTNVSIDGIRTAVEQLQNAYHDRGYVTVAVGLPQQKLTNAEVKIQVTEGRLVAIDVKGNRYFSSNNVMRAMPGLHTNMVLNSFTFQAELNRANANQDRQIYPLVGPGPDPGTSALTLQVKDQLPLHAKLELNNQSSPGTPDLRINGSAVYNNLWQQEHALGVQYSFSPEELKQGHMWDSYDMPAVANYSAFYRMPLGNPESLDDVIANNPGNFGYDEATHKFNLPPSTGQPALTVFGSRSTIDTGIEVLSDTTFLNKPGVRTLTYETDQQDNTINEDMGFRLNGPILANNTLHSSLAGGLDYKSYHLDSYKTNIFTDTETTYDANNQPHTRNIHTFNPVPDNTNGLPSGVTISQLNYLPLNLRYDGSMRNQWGLSTFGLGLGGNVWFSGSVSNLQSITGSTKSTGYWVVVNPSLSQDLELFPNWTTTVRADGQWASEPLISNEQFGAGGINSVRGYHEGDVFGDTGWHMTLEQQTPAHTVGIAYARFPLVLRGSVYLDYAHVYLLDPQGRQGSTELCGTGFGFVASVGPHWESRFLFSWPLLSTADTEAYQPFFNFALTAQF